MDSCEALSNKIERGFWLQCHSKWCEKRNELLPPNINIHFGTPKNLRNWNNSSQNFSTCVISKTLTVEAFICKFEYQTTEIWDCHHLFQQHFMCFLECILIKCFYKWSCSVYDFSKTLHLNGWNPHVNYSAWYFKS